MDVLRAPHFGGLWEAAVKSAKQHLRRVIGQQKLTFKEFYTISCQVERCMNSRPLLPISSHPTDRIQVLTPGHFLIGRPLCALPETSLTEIKSPLRRWTLCQSIVQHFWARWSSEYLQHLQKIPKWRTPNRNLCVGDVVIICEDNPFINHWPLAKIVAVFPGKDGKVRVVQVKTSTGILKRPTAKLALILSHDPDTTESGMDHSSFGGWCVEAHSTSVTEDVPKASS